MVFWGCTLGYLITQFFDVLGQLRQFLNERKFTEEIPVRAMGAAEDAGTGFDIGVNAALGTGHDAVAELNMVAEAALTAKDDVFS